MRYNTAAESFTARAMLALQALY